MLTLTKIKSKFTLVSNAFYHGIDKFPGHGKFCDVYFVCKNKLITQKQVDIYNDFKNNYKSHIPEIEQYIQNHLKRSEHNKSELIKASTLTFDVIEIQQDIYKYDMVLVCRKTFKQFLFFKKNISVRVEFKNGRIKSIKRKKDTTTEN